MLTEQQIDVLAQEILGSIEEWDAEAQQAAQNEQNPDAYTEVMLEKLRQAIMIYA